MKYPQFVWPLFILGSLQLSSALFATNISPQKPLTRQEAEARALQIKNPLYNLHFYLDNTSETFKVSEKISFIYSEDSTQEVFLELRYGTIHSFKINQMVATPNYDGSRLIIDKSDLIAGQVNTIQCEFTLPYNGEGEGLHRFVDEDGKVYLYSQGETYNANKFFLCFDQPDIKGKYTLKVTAPHTWEVISNTREENISRNDDYNEWQFPQTETFSTYLFALIAGPYIKWTKQDGDKEYRLFSRKSLQKEVNRIAEKWFEITETGFQFFESFFGLKYPFSKYDQILVPEFNAGAMENVGAVTFSESLAFRGDHVSSKQLGSLANTIDHEMAHQWFGNLVTMKWWNDLWLNESFAEVMAHYAVDHARETLNYLDNPWKSFTTRKAWGYQTDSRYDTTHPIVNDANDTEQAQAVFDGITYAKGASALIQLFSRIGLDSLKLGLKDYFNTYSFRNTTLDDFLSSLKKHTPSELEEFKTEWLETSGHNTIELNWSNQPNSVTSVELVQLQSPVGGPLRSHQTHLDFYGIKDQNLVLLSRTPVKYSGPSTKLDISHTISPLFIVPNSADKDFVRIRLDQTSLEQIPAYLSQVEDSITRQVVLQSMWTSVLTNHLPASKFMQILLHQIGVEQDQYVLSACLSWLSKISEYIAPNKLDSALQSIEAKLIEAVQAKAFSRLSSTLKTSLFKAAIEFSTSPSFLKSLLSSPEYQGLSIDQPIRWRVVQKLVSLTDSDSAREVLKLEEERDSTSYGKNMALGAHVAYGSKTFKKEWWDQLTKPNSKYSLVEKTQIMASFYQPGQEKITQFAKIEYFEALNTISEEQGDSLFYSRFARMMFPDPYTSQTLLDMNEEYLASNIPFRIKKILKNKRQEMREKLDAQKFDSRS